MYINKSSYMSKLLPNKFKHKETTRTFHHSKLLTLKYALRKNPFITKLEFMEVCL